MLIPPGHSSAVPGRTALQPPRPRDRECLSGSGGGVCVEARGVEDPPPGAPVGAGSGAGGGVSASRPPRPRACGVQVPTCCSGSSRRLRPGPAGPSPARVPPACRSLEPTDGRTDASDEGTSGRRREPEEQVSVREVPDPMLPTAPGAARTDDGPARASVSPGAGATRGSGQVCGWPGGREAPGREGTAPGPQAVPGLVARNRSRCGLACPVWSWVARVRRMFLSPYTWVSGPPAQPWASVR